MFDKKHINDIMEKAKKMQDHMNQLQEEIDIMQVTGEAGAGLIKVIVNGKHHCINIQIDPTLLELNKKEILEDLIVAALNNANQKIIETKKQKMSFITPQ